MGVVCALHSTLAMKVMAWDLEQQPEAWWWWVCWASNVGGKRAGRRAKPGPRGMWRNNRSSQRWAEVLKTATGTGGRLQHLDVCGGSGGRFLRAGIQPLPATGSGFRDSRLPEPTLAADEAGRLWDKLQPGRCGWAGVEIEFGGPVREWVRGAGPRAVE